MHDATRGDPPSRAHGEVDRAGRSARDPALDVARGMAIVAIVVGHVLRGLSASGDLDAQQPWYATVDTALYLVHLPVFFLLSAVFLARGVARTGPRAFLAQRLLQLVWVFVLWTAVQGLVMVLAGGAVNNRTTATDVVAGLWHPLGQYWFLPTLAVLTVATVVLAPWRSPARSALTLAAGVVVSLLAWGRFGEWSGTQGMGVAVFFAVGAVLGDQRARTLLRTRAATVAGAAGGAAYVLVLALAAPSVATASVYAATPSSVVLGVLASVGGTLAVLVVARTAAGLPGHGPVGYLGRHSLEVFVVHVVAASGSRIVLTRLGVDQPAVLAGLGVVAGLVGPLVLLLLARRLGARWLFAPPAVLSRQVERML